MPRHRQTAGVDSAAGSIAEVGPNRVPPGWFERAQNVVASSRTTDRQLGITKGGWCNIAWSRLLLSHGFSLRVVALCDPGPWVPTTSTSRSRLRDRPKEAWGGSTSPRSRVLRFNRLGMGRSIRAAPRPPRNNPSSEWRGGLGSMGRIRRHVPMGAHLWVPRTVYGNSGCEGGW